MDHTNLHQSGHRRKTVAAVLAGTAATAVASLLVGGTPAGPAASAAAGAGPTVTFDQTDGQDHFVDVAPLGGEQAPPSVGDEYVATNRLLDPSTGEQVGRSHSVCVTTRVVRHPLNAFANCTVVLRTSAGQLVLQASWSFNAAAQQLAVTGGTGDYAGSAGTGTWTSGDGDASSWEITLLP